MKKLVREQIFEKFTEDSDPIYDMGIGMKQIFKNIGQGHIFKLKRDVANLKAGSYIYVRRREPEISPEYKGKIVSFSFAGPYKTLSYLKRTLKDIEEGIKSNDPGWRRWLEREGNKWTMTYDFFRETLIPFSPQELKESFYTKVYSNNIHLNGESFFNVGGVPGSRFFLQSIENMLDMSGRIITKNIVDSAMNLLKKLSAKDYNFLKKYIDLPDIVWLLQFWGDAKTGELINDYLVKYDFYNKLEYPAATFLVWYLNKNIGNNITNFSY